MVIVIPNDYNAVMKQTAYTRPNIQKKLLTCDKEATFASSSLFEFHKQILLLRDSNYETTLPPQPFGSITTSFRNWLVDAEGYFLDDSLELLDDIFANSDIILSYYYHNKDEVLAPIITNNIRVLRNVVMTLETIDDIARECS